MSSIKWCGIGLVGLLGTLGSAAQAQEPVATQPVDAANVTAQNTREVAATETADPQPSAAESNTEPQPKAAEPEVSAGSQPDEPGPVGGATTTETPGPVEPPAAPSWLPDWTRHLKIGGGAILYYYQPLVEHQKNDLSFFFARLVVDADFGDFGVHLEPRFRDSRLRSYFEGPAWLQEAYASWSPGSALKVKVGKVYSRLGLFWDNSFYGNVQVYDGLKLATDYGVSLEGTFGDRVGLNYWAQFLIVDGRTNVSQPGRDTISIPGARRRNEVVLNAEPFLKFGDDGVIRVGASLQAFKADLPGDPDNVLRVAGHAKVTLGGFGAWGEIQHQSGRHVNAFPVAAVAATGDTAAIPGRASGDNTYFEVGAEYTLSGFTLRYNVSRGNYADVKTYEWLHVPAISYRIAAPLLLQAELAFWKRHTPEGSSNVDKSLNVTLHADF